MPVDKMLMVYKMPAEQLATDLELDHYEPTAAEA